MLNPYFEVISGFEVLILDADKACQDNNSLFKKAYMVNFSQLVADEGRKTSIPSDVALRVGRRQTASLAERG